MTLALALFLAYAAGLWSAAAVEHALERRWEQVPPCALLALVLAAGAVFLAAPTLFQTPTP